MNVSIVIGIISSVFLLAVMVALYYWMASEWLKCQKCGIRLASIRIYSDGRVTESEARRYGENVEYLGAKVCSTCWDNELNEIGFVMQLSWFPGAFVEYLKNTPAFLAFIMATAAFVLSLVNFFDQ